MSLKYLESSYIPKGKISHLKITDIDLMIQEQVYCGNKPDVKVFEKNYSADARNGGFNWDEGVYADNWCDFFRTGEKLKLIKPFPEFFKEEYKFVTSLAKDLALYKKENSSETIVVSKDVM